MSTSAFTSLGVIAASAAAIACACGPRETGPARAPLEVRVDGATVPRQARPPAPAPAGQERSPGENGPRTPADLIGEVGRLAPDPETTLFVNSREIRAHAWAEDLERAIASVLVGWDQFMPRDLVHPIRDVDWVVMAGDLTLGHTDDNVFVARYTFDEARADAVTRDLLPRLEQSGDVALGIAGASAIHARVDGADRAYVRAAPHVLAIVPQRQASAAATRIQSASVPDAPRPGELARLVTRSRAARRRLPEAIREVRAWLEPHDGRIALHVEGECPTDDAARGALEELKLTIGVARSRTLVRVALGGILSRAKLSRDGRVVRATTEIDQGELKRLVALTCSRTASCADEP